MSTEVVGRTLADLVRRVAVIEVRLGEDKPGGWQAIAGQTEQDDFFEEAVRHGAEWRSKGNQEER